MGKKYKNAFTQNLAFYGNFLFCIACNGMIQHTHTLST